VAGGKEEILTILRHYRKHKAENFRFRKAKSRPNIEEMPSQKLFKEN
jgi:hypothetical protein